MSESWKTNKYELDTFWNDQWVKEEITGETRKSFEVNENEDTTTQTYGMHLNQCLENYKYKCLYFIKITYQ